MMALFQLGGLQAAPQAAPTPKPPSVILLRGVEALEATEQRDLTRRLESLDRKFTFRVLFLITRSSPQYPIGKQSQQAAARWLGELRGAVLYYDATTETLGLGTTTPADLLSEEARQQVVQELAALPPDTIAHNTRRAIYLVASAALKISQSEPLGVIPMEPPQSPVSTATPPPAPIANAAPVNALPSATPPARKSRFSPDRLIERIGRGRVTVLASLATGALLAVLAIFYRLEYHTGRTYTIAERPVAIRFGGSVTGGHGATANYGSDPDPPAAPPSSPS